LPYIGYNQINASYEEMCVEFERKNHHIIGFPDCLQITVYGY